MLEELAKNAQHPTWERFATTMDDDVSVLMVHAPDGIGASWFTNSWRPGEDRRTTHVPADSYPQTASQLQLPESQSGTETASATVLLLESARFRWELLAETQWRMASAEDLLLSPAEIAELVSRIHALQDYAAISETSALEQAHRIYRATGGWLEPSLVLINDPAHTVQAQEMVLPFVARWVERVEAGQAIAMASYLPTITAASLDALFSEVSDEATTIEAMTTAGILREDSEGEYFLPEMIRGALQRLIRQDDPVAAEELTVAAMKTTTRSAGVELVLEQAHRRRKWQAFTHILGERWPDLFTSDARKINQLISLLPRRVVVSAFGDVAGVALRMAMGAGRDRMTFLLPSTEPHYPSDPVARRLREKSERLAADPDVQALTVGLLETGHLRLVGLYAHSDEAAGRLRQTLDQAMSLRPVRPLMASVVELQAGMSLHIGGSYLKAKHAYEAALYWAGGAESFFQHANATANLALLAAQGGYTADARQWLHQHDETIIHVGWGKNMVARGADLARVLIALTELDLPTADDMLNTLPSQPDTDELWPAHAYAIALRNILAGRAHEAVNTTTRMRKDRPYASQSALAEQLLSLADHLALLHSPTTQGAVSPRESVGAHQSRFFEVLHKLLLGDFDSAQTLLQAIPLTELGPRWRNITGSLYPLFDLHPPIPQPASLAKEVSEDSAELLDVVIPYLTGALEESGDINLLSTEQQQRLAQLPRITLQRAARPPLTTRELEILHLLRLGKTRRDIAALEHRSENTVKAQIRSLYQKLDANSLDEALDAALKWGF
ncbi:LuxR C-terminal-related transcriptional regulator [Nesterenkonia halotolerans]|uniref:DNA-binding CsgD family transcriptional regulator n=1 Tax=Nesterenkonia halotolerans TaxID=225325 RepID=A0ABR9J7D1_9MICC|nr:LuxR C-terminal-related transcriptional regulator [Nesterenkonia halotolerans]MBE1514912.1 DNA-binding CsgD family transcriptional regulator [Nesterenkonia halotolerans]